MLVLFFAKKEVFKLNLKEKKVLKKFLIVLMIIFLLIGNMPKIFAISGSGSGIWKVSEQYNSSIKTTDYSTTGIYGIMMRSMTNTETGETITVFCAEHRNRYDNRRNFFWGVLYTD